MRKFSLVLATTSLTVSLGAFAAIPTDAALFELVVPNLKSGLDITLEGLLLQPGNSDVDYATTYTVTTAANTHVQSVDPSYDVGFRVGLGYTFPESGNDVQTAWTHFNSTDTHSLTLAPGSVLLPRLYALPLAAFDNTIFDFVYPPDVRQVFSIFGSQEVSATSTVETKLDAIDLDVGQYMDVGTRLRMRLFGGLRFARVSSDLSSEFHQNSSGAYINFPGITFTNTFSINEQLNSKFTGMGPRVGVDSVYHVGNCFGVVARAAVALLVGETQSDGKFTSSSTHTDLPNDSLTVLQFAAARTLNSADSDRIVPVLDAKLGLNYSFTFDNQSMLTIEAGYQATQYVDAIDRLDIQSEAPNAYPENPSAPVPVPVSFTRTTSSIGFGGPYLSLNWKV